MALRSLSSIFVVRDDGMHGFENLSHKARGFQMDCMAEAPDHPAGLTPSGEIATSTVNAIQSTDHQALAGPWARVEPEIRGLQQFDGLSPKCLGGPCSWHNSQDPNKVTYQQSRFHLGSICQ